MRISSTIVLFILSINFAFAQHECSSCEIEFECKGNGYVNLNYPNEAPVIFQPSKWEYSRSNGRFIIYDEQGERYSGISDDIVPAISRNDFKALLLECICTPAAISIDPQPIDVVVEGFEEMLECLDQIKANLNEPVIVTDTECNNATNTWWTFTTTDGVVDTGMDTGVACDEPKPDYEYSYDCVGGFVTVTLNQILDGVTTEIETTTTAQECNQEDFEYIVKTDCIAGFEVQTTYEVVDSQETALFATTTGIECNQDDVEYITKEDCVNNLKVIYTFRIVDGIETQTNQLDTDIECNTNDFAINNYDELIEGLDSLSVVGSVNANDSIARRLLQETIDKLDQILNDTATVNINIPQGDTLAVVKVTGDIRDTVSHRLLQELLDSTDCSPIYTGVTKCYTSVPGSEPLSLPTLTGTLNDEITTWDIATALGTAIDISPSGGMQWGDSGISDTLVITFTNPVNFRASHVDDATNLSTTVQTWHSQGGLTTMLVTNGQFVSYNPGTLSVAHSQSGGNIIYTGNQRVGILTSEDWGEFLFENVTEVRIAAVAFDVMQFNAVVQLDPEQRDASLIIDCDSNRVWSDNITDAMVLEADLFNCLTSSVESTCCTYDSNNDGDNDSVVFIRSYSNGTFEYIDSNDNILDQTITITCCK